MEPTGRRARKKRETYRALCGAAQELVHERGLDEVTVEDIAEAADVSVRTFFNYFPCKEAALVGIDPDVLTEIADEVRQRPDHEEPAEALRAVLLGDVDPGEMLRRRQLRNDLVERYPALLPRHLASMIQVEVALAAAVADRMGVDAATDPVPRVLVAAVMAGLRAGMRWWQESDRTEPLADVVDRAFGIVVADLSSVA
jgi:AcrR family transcriptional regulator